MVFAPFASAQCRKKRKKPDKFLLPHGMPSDERAFAFSSRVLPKALKIKAPYKSWHYQ
jgi:hypothetical protein